MSKSRGYLLDLLGFRNVQVDGEILPDAESLQVGEGLTATYSRGKITLAVDVVPFRPVVEIASTTTLSDEHWGLTLLCTSSGATTLTVGGPGSAAFFRVVQMGTGQVTVAGSTIRTPDGFEATTRGQYSTMEAQHVGDGEWVVSGDLEVTT